MTSIYIKNLIYFNGENCTPTVIFHEDSGHGWLQVPLALLQHLKIVDKITPYSYLYNSVAFLEEDVDLSTFFNAIHIGCVDGETEERKALRKLFWSICPKRYQEYSFIRNLSPFKS